MGFFAARQKTREIEGESDGIIAHMLCHDTILPIREQQCRGYEYLLHEGL